MNIKSFFCTLLISIFALHADNTYGMEHITYQSHAEMLLAQKISIKNNSYNLLQYAILRFSNVSILQSLIENKADINEKDALNCSSALLAYTCHHKEALSLLIDHPAIDLNAQDANGTTLLSRVTRNENGPLIARLIARGCSVALPDNDGLYPIHHAIASGYKENVDALFSTHSVAFQTSIQMPNSTDLPPLHVAAQEGNLEKVLLLLSQKADVAFVHPSSGYSALHCAARRPNNTAIITVLLQAGAHCSTVSLTNKTPAMCATELGDIDNINALLSFEKISL